MTLEELSERIIDGTFFHSDEENAFAHYGVLGMKWGVRKDRKREDETDQQYKDRLDRESRERTAKADRKARAKEQKRSLRSQERIEKIRTRAQLKQTQKQLDAQAKQREAQQKQQDKERRKQERKKTKSDIDKNKKESSTKLMSDQELRDAINRMQMERNYKQLSKKPDNLGKKAFMALAVPVGMTIIKSQLTKLGGDLATEKMKPVRSKLGLKNDDKGGSKIGADEVNRIIEEAFIKRGL